MANRLILLGRRRPLVDRFSWFPLNRRWGFLGDSITNASSATNSVYAFPRQSCEFAGTLHNPASLATVKGVSGNTSAQMLSRALADLPFASVDGLVVLAGTNDSADANAVSVATFGANITAICAAYVGKQVVLVTPPPRGAPSADERQRLIDYSDWIRTNAAGLGAKVADAYDALDDGTDTLLSSCNSGDNVHPNNLGHQKIARLVGEKMLEWQTPRTSIVDALQGVNLISNGLITGTLGAGDPTGWTTGTPGSQTFGTASVRSIVAAPTGRAGQAYRLDINAAVASRVRRRASAISTTVGDKLLFVGRVAIAEVSGDWAATSAALTADATLKLNNLSSGVDVVTGPVSCAALDRQMAFTYTVGSGVTSIGLNVSLSVPSGSNFQADWHEIGAFNLTALGYASDVLI